jgi:hypothetical protein
MALACGHPVSKGRLTNQTLADAAVFFFVS